MVKIAYERECEHLKGVDEKADNLTKYVSVYLVMLNILVPIMVKLNLTFSVPLYLIYFLRFYKQALA
jgi:hypothetical protein